MGIYVLCGVRTELLHEAQDLFGMPEFLEHDSRGGDSLFQPGRQIDAISEARGPCHHRINEYRHQAHHLAPVSGCDVIRGAQLATARHIAQEVILTGHLENIARYLSKSTTILSVAG